MLRFLRAADILGKRCAVAVWLKCREYSTSRGPPPCQRASWIERPSCGGRWKKRQASLKKAKTAGKQWDGGLVTVSPDMATTRKKIASTAASVTLRCC